MIKYLLFRIKIYIHVLRQPTHRLCKFETDDGRVMHGCYDCNKLMDIKGIEYNIAPPATQAPESEKAPE